MRERVARAAYNHGAHKTDTPWERLRSSTKKDWLGYADAVLAELAPELSPQAELSIAAAHEIGKHGGPVVEAERLAFEAWSRGHCWALCATWDGKQYRSDAEQGCIVDPRAVTTRLLFAAWRDRAALAAPQPQASAEDVRRMCAAMDFYAEQEGRLYGEQTIAAKERIRADYERMGVVK
jgi:hypothetical protein